MPSFLSRTSPWRHWLAGGLLLGLLVVGLAIWRDYGMSYDAGQSRNIGMVSLRYVAEQLDPAFLATPAQQALFEQYRDPLLWFADRDYGVAFELPVTLGERLLELPTNRAIYQYRHLCTFLVGWVGVLALYGLGKRRYHDWRWGLLAAALLVCSPRLFGELFYNDKDAVFMALCTVATYTAVRFVGRPTWGWAALHALACAIAIDVRLMAVLWPVATGGLLLWRQWAGDYGPRATRRLAGPAALYLLLLPALVVALWPYLWSDPLGNFLTALHNMSRFRWGMQVLYRGELIIPAPPPWHYLFKWIGITTPLLQLGLIVLGIGVVARQLARSRWLYQPGTDQWQELLFLVLGVGPVVVVVALRSVLYDGWRQLYFVYPSLLLLGLRAAVALARWARSHAGWAPAAAGVVLGAGLLTSAVQLVQLHPFQSLYFSVLAGPDFVHRYEQDYWGISYGQGLRWIVAHDARPVLRVATDQLMSSPLDLNRDLLPDSLQRRLQVVSDPAQANYYLGSYRWHPQDYDFPHKAADIRAGQQQRILSIFALR